MPPIERKQVTLPDFLTPAQIQRCTRLYPDRIKIRDEVIVPNMAVINEKLGQENDPDYLAWAVIYVLQQASK